MKELCKLAEDKGFQCRTFSTRWTMDHYIERGKAKFMVNKECMIILLAEIQYWLREVHKIHITIQRVVGNRGTSIETESWTFEGSPWKTYPTYEESLIQGLLEALKLIPDAEIQDN